MKNKKLFYVLSFVFAQNIFIPFAYAQVATTTTSTDQSLVVNLQPTSTPASDVSTSTAISSSSTQTTSLGLQLPPVPAIITEINNAKILLANINLNYNLLPVYKNIKNKKTKKITKIISSYDLTSKDIALAILDPSTGNIVTTVGSLTGKKMVFPDPNVNVQLTYFNGVNSRFQINTPANGTVLAVKYLISGPDSGSKAAILNALSPAVYVPYSQNLDSPDVIIYGQNYLNGVINTVTEQLNGLPSFAVPGETITQAVPPSLIKALVYAEHSDTAAILKGNVQNSLDQMNILLALNGPDTYKYSVSNDGFSSRGIAQFIKSTYESLVTRHPQAGLNPDYVAGMEDHVNSVKAMYLLLDDYAGDVRIKAPNGFVASRVFDYGAASYNGGTTRVAKAVNEFGDSWNQDRSGQINSIQSQVNSLASQIKSLKSKIKKALDKKAKTSLQSQLASSQSQLGSASNQLTNLQDATLRNETVNYLNKIYKVVQYFNQQQV